MGVRKYRSIAEVPPHPARPPLDPENLRIGAELMDLANRLSPLRATPGVLRFRSYDELVRFHHMREVEQTGRGAKAPLQPGSSDTTS